MMLLIDRTHLQDVRLPAQAVEQLHHPLPVAHHVGLRRAGVVQIGEGDVAHAFAQMLLLLVEVGRDLGHDRFLVDRLTVGAGGDGKSAEVLDPVIDRFDLLLRRLSLAVEILIAIVGHLLLGDLDEQLGAVGIAGKDEIRVFGKLVEMQDVAEILGGLFAFQSGAGLMAA
jgi:hypothetical protein